MFDIGLFELLVVGGVGLVVIGPERLPGAIKTGALWVGRIKRSITNTRREIEQHIGADEIRRELRNEEIMASLEKLKETRAQIEADIKGAASLEHDDDDHYTPDNHHDEHGNYVGSPSAGNHSSADDNDAHHADNSILEHDDHHGELHSREAAATLSDAALESADAAMQTAPPLPEADENHSKPTETIAHNTHSEHSEHSEHNEATNSTANNGETVGNEPPNKDKSTSSASTDKTSNT